MSLCKNCISGVTHTGIPTGVFGRIGGINCYSATPREGYAKDTVLLYLTNVFGIPLRNNQLIVDDFARNGFRTIAIDYFDGDEVPEKFAEDFDLDAWIARHGREVSRPPLNAVISALRSQGVQNFGAAGYCVGARYAFDLAFEGIIKAAVISHPSLLEFPADFQTYASTVKAPLLINSCEFDEMFPKEIHAQVDALFRGFTPGYNREYFEGCTHGFSVRADLSDPKMKAGKEGAFVASVNWFKKYLT